MPEFRWLWFGALVSLAGTHMQFVALPYFVHEQTGSSLATALAAAAQALPGVTLAPFAGAVADSRDCRRLLIGANIVLAAITLAFCLTLVAPWWVVVVVVFLQAAVAQLVAPAEVVLVPSLLPPASLPAANSLSAANNSLARLIGPAAGGLLYATSGLPVVAVANALSFAVAALLVSRISPRNTWLPAHPQQPTQPQVRTTRPGLTGGWAAGWAEIRRQPLLRRLLVVFVLTGIGEGCVSALLAPYTAEAFGSSTALGLLLTCQAAGGTVGALVMSRWAIIDRLPQTLSAAAITCAVLLAVMIGYPLFYPPLWPALLLIAVAGLPFAAAAAAQATLLQTLPHPDVRGSVYGVTIAAAGAAQLLGILTSGYLADRTSVYLLLADAPCSPDSSSSDADDRTRPERPQADQTAKQGASSKCVPQADGGSRRSTGTSGRRTPDGALGECVGTATPDLCRVPMTCGRPASPAGRASRRPRWRAADGRSRAPQWWPQGVLAVSLVDAGKQLPSASSEAGMSENVIGEAMSGTVTGVPNVALPVTDQEPAADFYVNVLGLDQSTDLQLEQIGARWVEVAATGAETSNRPGPGRRRPAQRGGNGHSAGDLRR